jgi:hypothetical protein
MNKDVCAGDILIDKLVGKIEKLRKLLFGRVINGQIEIAGNLLLGVTEEESLPALTIAPILFSPIT